MKKCKCLAFILLLILTFSTMNLLVVQRVSATPDGRIILPFDTSWESNIFDEQPEGRVNSFDYKKAFSSPELGRVYKEVETPDDEVYGFDFEDYQLRAAGSFGSSYSYCYFNLFDMTPECDARPPFKIRPHTFISIFYYHDLLRDCMIDAQLYNKRTHQYWTLRDFNYDGKYIVDQNGVRIHPAHRLNDPLDSWQFASFDLSIIYEQDPDNWFVTKIWIGFDNGISGTTGQAITYFDLLAITYGVGQKFHFEDEANPDDNAWISATIEAWEAYHTREGKYDLRLKVGVAGFDDGHVDYGAFLCSIFPYLMEVSTDADDAMVVTNPEPTGVNLTKEEEDPNLPPGEAAEFVLDIATLIATHYYPPLEATLTVISLATSFFGLLTPAPEQPLYEWPEADWGDKMGFPHVPLGNWDPKNLIAGEVYIQIPGLDRGTHSFEFTFTVGYYIKDWYEWQFALPLWYRSCELTLNFEWTTEPDDVNLPPEKPSTPSGETSGCVGSTYWYSTYTTDPEGNDVRYEFDWGDDTTGTTGWHASGDNASASHSWSSSGTYVVKVRAQDLDGYLNGYWSGWSPPLTVTLNPGLTVLALDPGAAPPFNSLTTGDVYIDDEWCGLTGSTFTVLPGTHKVFVNDFWESGITGCRYGFEHWEDGPTDNPRTITVVEDTMITACFSKEYCPGDVDGSGFVDEADLDILTASWDSVRGDPNWDSRADLDCDWSINGTDMTIVTAYITLLNVLADQDGNSLTTGYVYIDNEFVGHTNSTFIVSPENHTVYVSDFWESGGTGYRYSFTHWEDNSTGNPRTIKIAEPGSTTTIKAYFKKKWCPGDCNGDGHVDVSDLTLLASSWYESIPPGDPRVDLNGDDFVDVSDVTIVASNWFNEYPDP